jgi:hypothetical protein
MRAVAMVLSAALAIGTVTACAPGESQSRTVHLSAGLTAAIAGGSAKISAAAGPQSSTAALTGHLPVKLLAPAEQVTIHGRLPATGAVLTWHINPRSLPPGITPFVASKDQAAGGWAALPGNYDHRTGTISVRVRADPLLALLGWVPSWLGALFKGLILGIFGLSGSNDYPQCSSYDIAITDRHPAQASVGYCAQPADSSHVLLKLANMRPYPVDVTYPPGTAVSPSVVSRAVVAGPNRAILLGLDHLDGTVPLSAGQTGRVTVSLDGAAAFAGLLLAVQNLADDLAEKLGVDGKRKAILSAIEDTKCFGEAELSLDSVPYPSLDGFEHAGSVITDCVGRALEHSSGALQDVGKGILTLTAVVGDVLFGTWAVIDKLMHTPDHVLTLQRSPSPGQSSPASFPIQYPGDMTLACIQQYGQGTQAQWVDTVSPPAYGVQCFQRNSLLGGLDLTKWCPAAAALHHYSSPAGWYSDNPNRYSAATSTIKPWETWTCNQG